jgi:hypothetical protein
MKQKASYQLQPQISKHSSTMEKYFVSLKRKLGSGPKDLKPWLLQPSVMLNAAGVEALAVVEEAEEGAEELDVFHVASVSFLERRPDGGTDICATWTDGSATREDADSFGSTPGAKRSVKRCT